MANRGGRRPLNRRALGVIAEIILFRLRMPENAIEHWAGRYAYAAEPTGAIAAARRRGYLQYGEFLEIAKWKTPRSRSRCLKNEPAFVEEVTRLALHPSEITEPSRPTDADRKHLAVRLLEHGP
jgi:hypothetical protein